MKEILVGNNVLEFPDEMSAKDIAGVIDAQLPDLDPAALKDPAAKEAWAKRTTAASLGLAGRAVVDIGDTYQGLETSAKIGWNALGKAVNTLRGTEDVRPTIGQEWRAYQEAQADPDYTWGLAQSNDPRRLALLEQRLGPRAKLDQRLAGRNAAVLGSRQAVAEQVASEAALSRSEAQRDLAAQIGVANQWAAWRRNPVELTASIALESLAPSLAGAAAGTVIGGPGPGTAAGVGLTSFGLTLSSELLGYAQQDGINIQDPDAFGIWLDSPAFERAFDKARDKATVVGGVDSVTAGIAGRFIGPALRQGLRQTVVASGKELALQMAGGAAGEAGGQLAAGQPLNTFGIGMEAMAEVVSGPGEVAANIRNQRSIGGPGLAENREPSASAVQPAPKSRPTAETLTAAQAEAGLTEAPDITEDLSPIERLIAAQRAAAEPKPTDLDYGAGGELPNYTQTLGGQPPPTPGSPGLAETREGTAGPGDTAEATTAAQPRQPGGQPKPTRTPAQRKALSARHRFNRETEALGTDILDWIVNNGGLMSARTARRAKGAQWFKANKSLWDDAPPMQSPHHNVIYRKGGGRYPDQLARDAHAEGLIPDGQESTFWEAVRQATITRAGGAKQLKVEQQLLNEMAQERVRFDKATQGPKAKGEVEVGPDQLSVGDVLDVDGTEIRVKSIDPDTGDVLLEDGTRFGNQILREGERILVEKIDEAPNTIEDAWDAPAAEPAPGGPGLAETGESFTLDTPESVEAQNARLAREAAQRKIAERQAKPLKGSAGDLGQGNLTGEREDLWAPPSADERAAAVPAADQTAPVLLQKAKRPPKNTKDWPNPELPEGQEVVFMQYGPAGSGFYVRPEVPKAKAKSSTSRGYAPPPGSRSDAASTAGQAWPGADLGTPAPPGPVDDPNHSAFPIELPELVWFAQQLGRGKFPRLRERLRGALGRFHFVQGQPASGRISLLRSLFQLVTPEEQARIVTAANDYAQALGLDPKETERVAKEKAQFELDQLRQEREKQNPLLASKVLAHEIGHWIDFLPQAMIAGRGNILGRIASLADYLKTTMPAHYGGDFESVLTKQDRAKLRRQAERETGKRPPKDEPEALVDWQKEVAQRYSELLEDEIAARGLISTKLIKAELEPLIAWWRGSGESMEEYFADADEMFAEALSIFLNNPQAMQKRAPQFYAAWMSWMEAKPPVRKLWTDIQNGIRSGQIHKDRVTRLLDSWDRLDAANLDRANRRRLRTARHYLDNVSYHLSDTFGPVYRLAGKTYSRLGDLRQAIGDFRYRATEHELFLGRMNREVGGRLVRAGLDWKWLGELMFHRHIVNNRKDIANPHGWNVKASTERLAAMESELGPDRWRALNDARAMFRTIYEDMVVRPINASGMFRKELLDAVNERVFYATFAASQGPVPQSGIEALIDFYAGNGVGSQIYKQVGHLGDVQNPATATVLKALSLMSALRRNAVKRELIDLMQANDPANIKPADQRWTGQRREFKTIESPTVGTVTYLEDGKPKAFYVPRLMADTVNQAPASQNELWLMYNRAMGWVKAAFTQLNYGFWPVNFLKDTVGWNLQVPGANPVAYAKQLPRALAAARASVKQRDANPDADAALRRLVLISKADPRGVWATAADELERRILSYGMDPRQWDAQGKKAHALVRLWNEYRELGQTFERVNKIAGMLHLDEKFPAMPEWQKREIIRERAGSPDFLRRGASATGADILMMFYNPWKEGLRSIAKTARDNPYSFTGKMLLAVGTPTTLMALGAAGGMGDDKKRQYAAVPDYDLSNYIVWPLGWVDESRQKVAYLRLPLWEPARIFHGLLWHTLTGRGKSINAYLGGQVPGLSPVVSTAADWWQFAQGENPYDSFRQREVIDPDLFASDKTAAAVELAKHTWNEFGGGLLMRFDQKYLGDPEPTDLEKFLKLPFVSNLLGRWIKVSNRGVFEQDKKLNEEIEKARAGIRVAVDKSIVRLQQGEALTDAEMAVILDPYGMEYFTQKFIGSELSRSSLFLQRMQRIPTQQGRIGAITNNPAGITP